jgi:hypothetical protein
MCNGLDSKTAAMAENRQAACPYLPPEIWNRIFFYNTDHVSLWSVGRKVCSTWRSEIPKCFAKKYLENKDMVQVYFLSKCSLEMIFDRYEEGAKHRCVFKETPRITGRIGKLITECFRSIIQEHQRMMFDGMRKGIELYRGSKEKESRGRFDLPPYQIQIKMKANDTELPQLEFDFERREISFEWEGMFDRFYREAAGQEKREPSAMAEAVAWLDGESRNVSNSLKLSDEKKAARKSIAKEIRRDRIKKWHLENHDFQFEDPLFDVEAEDKALDAVERHETCNLGNKLIRSAEEYNERRFAWSLDLTSNAIWEAENRHAS